MRVAEELLAPAPARRSVSTRSAPAAKRIFSSSASTLQVGVGVAQTTRRPGSRACWRGSRVRPWRTVAARRARRRPPRRRRAARRPAACRCAPGSARAGVSARRTNDSTEPPFCAKPMKSSTLAALAFEVRGHRDQRADRHDAGAADAGDQQVVGRGPARAAPGSGSAVDALREARPRRPPSAPALLAQPCRRRRRRSSGRSPWRRSSPCCSCDWSILRLRPELRFERQHGDAVALHASSRRSLRRRAR